MIYLTKTHTINQPNGVTGTAKVRRDDENGLRKIELSLSGLRISNKPRANGTNHAEGIIRGKGVGLHSSHAAHLIPDRFGVKAENGSMTAVATSANYNGSAMKSYEEQICKMEDSIPKEESALLTMLGDQDDITGYTVRYKKKDWKVDGDDIDNEVRYIDLSGANEEIVILGADLHFETLYTYNKDDGYLYPIKKPNFVKAVKPKDSFSGVATVELEKMAEAEAFRELMTSVSSDDMVFINRKPEQIMKRLEHVQAREPLARRVRSFSVQYTLSDGSQPDPLVLGRDIQLEMPDRKYTEDSTSKGQYSFKKVIPDNEFDYDSDADSLGDYDIGTRDVSTMNQRLKALSETSPLSNNDLAKEVGSYASQFSGWKTKGTIKPEVIRNLAAHFDTTIQLRPKKVVVKKENAVIESK
jgi:hypothetical protein